MSVGELWVVVNVLACHDSPHSTSFPMFMYDYASRNMHMEL